MTIDAGRLQRAVWLEVRPIDGGCLVRGGADDHIVEIDDGLVRCDCFDAQWRGDGCKHSLAVRLHHGDPEVVKALRALVPAPAGRSTQHRRTELSGDQKEQPR